MSLVGVCLGIAGTAYAADEAPELSLADLMKLEVTTATLTGSSASKVPVSVTTITANDIERTPARNIYDLIEIYVPGANYTYHGEGFHPGIRGIFSDRDVKILLLVNGKVLNQTAHNGAVSELGNWDLADIERIDIIRGPGSVTYGPGAIAGVFSITTKDAKSAPGLTGRVKYVATYNSKGASASYGTTLSDDVQLFGYGSVFSTQGTQSKNFTVDHVTGVAGFVGSTDFGAGSLNGSNPAMHHLGDYDGEPQIKLHVGAKLFKEWEFFARYTTLGTALPTLIAGQPQTTHPDGRVLDFKQFKDQHVTVAAKNDHEFLPWFKLSSMLSWNSENYKRRTETIYQADLDHLQNFRARFSEDELAVRSLANFKFGTLNKSAIGVEVARKTFGPGWGDPATKFRMGDANDIISGPDSEAIGTPGADDAPEAVGSATFVGNGWGTNTFSVFGESSFDFNQYFGLLLSGRADKNTFSKTLYSPRVAVVSQLGESSFLKLIAQKSMRMNMAEQLLLESRRGRLADPEVLVGYEAIYETALNNDTTATFSTFYDTVQNLSWVAASQSTTLTGTLDLWGVEGEIKHQKRPFAGGLSHSFVKQLDWNLAPGITSGNVSYSTYNRNVGSGVILTGVGNDLANWANHSTKFHGVYDFSDKLSFFSSVRVFWGYEGEKNMLKVVERGVAGTGSEGVADEAIRKIREEGLYDIQYRLDASAKYSFTDKLSVSAYLYNLLGNQKRLAFDGGTGKPFPNRAGYIEEPRTVGIQVKYTL